MAPSKPLSLKALRRTVKHQQKQIQVLLHGKFNTVQSQTVTNSTWLNALANVYPTNSTVLPLWPGYYFGWDLQQAPNPKTILKTLEFTCRLKPVIDSMNPSISDERKYRLSVFYVYKKLPGTTLLTKSDFFDNPDSILSQFKLDETPIFKVLYDELYQPGSIEANKTTINGGSSIITRKVFINRPTVETHPTGINWLTTTKGFLYIAAMAEGGTNATGGCAAFEFSKFNLSYVG